MSKTIRSFIYLGILVAIFGMSTHAQTINAASCNASDVQAAFNQVTASTTTVNIPAGTCSWTTSVTLTVPSGSATLSVNGAGSLTTTGGGDATIFVDNSTSGNPLLSVNTNNTASSDVRLAGITIKGGSSGATKYNGVLAIGGSSQNFRMDHSHIDSTTYASFSGTLVRISGCLYGVIDHSIFDSPAGSVTNAIQIYNAGSCNGDSLGVGDQAWASPTALGSANFMFVEGNVFNGGAGNDCLDGGRYVWRFNTMNMSAPPPAVQTHPTGSAGRIRGCRAWEIYENDVVAQPSNYINTLFWLSSGTGVFWGNTIPSSTAGGGTGFRSVINLNSMRASSATYSQTAPPNGWGYCGSGSNWDGNQNATTGYPCLDQPGRGQGDLLTGGFTSDGSGSNNVTNATTGCTSSQTCAWPREALEPIYEWADAYGPVPNNQSGIVAPNEGASDFTANMDYYLGTADSGAPISFNGTSGVGTGTLASRPSTCTTGVAYWATDQGNWNQSGSGGQGELYKCTATNTWTLYYAPYTYPHPLTLGQVQGSGNPPVAPSNLTASVQ